MNLYVGQKILYRSSLLKFDVTGVIASIEGERIYFWADRDNDVHYGHINEITPLEDKIPYDKLFPNATHDDLFKVLKPFNQTRGNYGVTITFYDRNSGHMNFKIDGGNERWEIEFDSLSEAIAKAQDIIDKLNPEFQEIWDYWNIENDEN